MENEKINPSDDLVAQFILKSLPKQTLGAFRLMTIVKYPIEDRQAFVSQLDSLLDNTEEAKQLKDTVRHVKESLTPLDFPMLSLQSGLEKLHTKLSYRFPSDPDLFVPGIGDTLENPEIDVLSDYERQFGPCARRAYEAYLEILEDPDVHPINAYIFGQKAGYQCLRSLGRSFGRGLPGRGPRIP